MAEVPNTFFRNPQKLVLDKNISEIDLNVLTKIVELSQKKGYCYATDKKLSEYIGRGIRSVSNSIKKLYDLGYIDKTTQFKDGDISSKKRKIYASKIIKQIYSDTNKKQNKKASSNSTVDVSNDDLPF